MSRDSILLFGGTGFIGRALAQRLGHEGRDVHILGRHNADRLADWLPHCGTVVHLASATTPGSSSGHPSLELDNLAPTLQLLEAMQAYPETHLIFVSSGGTVYGNPSQIPVNEDAPFAPRSYHGAGKMALEGFLHAFRAAGNAVTVLRPSNAYGPGQELRQGFGFVRTVLEHARSGLPLEIWGNGEAVRDFVYVEDVAEAIALAVANPADSGTYNVGSGQGHTLNEVLALARRVTGADVNTVYKPARAGDVRGVVLEVSRIRSVLGWQPRIGLEEGLRRTWEWLQRA